MSFCAGLGVGACHGKDSESGGWTRTLLLSVCDIQVAPEPPFFSGVFNGYIRARDVCDTKRFESHASFACVWCGAKGGWQAASSFERTAGVCAISPQTTNTPGSPRPCLNTALRCRSRERVRRVSSTDADDTHIHTTASSRPTGSCKRPFTKESRPYYSEPPRCVSVSSAAREREAKNSFGQKKRNATSKYDRPRRFHLPICTCNGRHLSPR